MEQLQEASRSLRFYCTANECQDRKLMIVEDPLFNCKMALTLQCKTCNGVKPLTEYQEMKEDTLNCHDTCKACRSRGTKVCLDCGREKSHSEFASATSHSDNYNSYCKPCAKIRIHAIVSEFKGYMKQLYRNLIGNATPRDIKIEIKLEDIIALYDKQGGRCALTGIPMTHMRQDPEKTVGDRYYYNISVDRVNPRGTLHQGEYSTSL